MNLRQNFPIVLFLATCMFCGCDKDNGCVEPTEIKEIQCEPHEITIAYEGTQYVEYTVSPADADSKDVRWVFADSTIAKAINENTIFGMKAGETWGYLVSCTNTDVKDSVRITVLEKQFRSIPVDDANIHYEGRVVASANEVAFFYPGSSISVDFTGTTLYAKLSQGDIFYWVEIDNQEPYKLAMNSKANWVKSNIFRIAEGLENGTHTAKITLCSEAILKNARFYGFEIDETAEVTKPAEKPLKFEFIGNSITCGYGTEAASHFEHFSDATSNFCHTFAYAAAKEFNAEIMVVARSGIGVYRNYGDETTATEFGSMPNNYEKTWLTNNTAWDFSTYTPDVVFINLGTNDAWKMETLDSTKFDNEYRKLLNSVTTHYPHAKVVLLTGSMLDASQLKVLKPIIDNLAADYNTDEHPFYRFHFNAVAGDGADWHPNAKQQATMGRNLISFLQRNGIVTK